MKYLKQIGLALLLALACMPAWASSAPTASLADQLVASDSRFFAAVFTTRDESVVERMLAPGFTFTANGKTRSREHFLANLEKMWQQMEGGMRMRRELVDGSVRAHREGDNAILEGVQKLYAVAGGQEQLVETSAFRRTLRNDNGQWILLSEETSPVPPEQTGSAQVDTLSKELAAADQALFDALFATHDFNAARGLLTDDFEFYHDRNGLVSETGDAFIASIARHQEPGLHRRIVADSVQTFALHGFGALQQGVHEFYRSGDGKPATPVSRARFMHVWQRVGDGWKLKREFSYDHQEQ